MCVLGEGGEGCIWCKSNAHLEMCPSFSPLCFMPAVYLLYKVLCFTVDLGAVFCIGIPRLCHMSVGLALHKDIVHVQSSSCDVDVVLVSS